jgi:hypothetical protein
MVGVLFGRSPAPEIPPTRMKSVAVIAAVLIAAVVIVLVVF